MKKTSIFLSFVMVLLLLCTACSEEQNNKKMPTSVWDGKSVDMSWYSAVESELTITSAAQFAGFAKLVNEGNSFYGLNIELKSNIDLGGYEWVPIGTNLKPYNGTFEGFFDGNGCVISNFAITDPELVNLGVFGVNYGVITNLGVEDFAINIKRSEVAFNVGGLVGYSSGQIDRCYSKGVIDIYSLNFNKVGLLAVSAKVV